MYVEGKFASTYANRRRRHQGAGVHLDVRVVRFRPEAVVLNASSIDRYAAIAAGGLQFTCFT
jgi:hypothetical protein